MHAHALAFLLVLLAAAQAAAQPAAPIQAGEWRRMPRDARLNYMTGAAAGVRAFSDVHPDQPRLTHIRVDRAVDAMDRMSADSFTATQPMMTVVHQALKDARDKGTPLVVQPGQQVRDPQDDAMILFDYPWLWPINLDSFVPTAIPGPKPTFGQSWLSANQAQKQFFLEGFGDMVADLCQKRFGHTPRGNACLRPLIPVPPNLVLSGMDMIYRDQQYAGLGYDVVMLAALAKVNGDDWKAVLTHR
jgi:hypothetical protein